MRESERDELVEIMEQMGGLSHTAAAAAIAQGATASSLASATLPGLVQREQTNVFQPLRFDSVMPPGKRAIHTETTVLPSRPGSAKRSPPRARPWSHSLGRRPVTAPTSAAASAAPSAQNSRPPSAATRPPSARGRAPPRAKSPSDRRLGRELKKAAAEPTSPSGFRRPADYSPRHAETSDDIFSPKKKKGATPKEGRWVHHPVSDLWALRAAEGQSGTLQWVPLVASGSRPFPRSRHSFVGVPARGLALLSGGRSVKAAVVLRDLYVLDVEATAWTLIEFCGVPPSARECVGSLALGPTLMVFGGRGRTCRNDLALFSLKRESRAGDIPKEGAGMWEHPLGQNAPPGHRQGHAAARLTSRSVLVFGGHSTDDDGWCEAAPWTATVVPSAVALPELTELSPPRAAVEGGVRLTVRGRGFKVGANHKVRFTVPTAPTPPPPPSSSLRGAAFPLKKLAAEAAVIVPAELDADGVTLRCVTPDLSDLVCDGSVLVEACVCETASDMQWTHDELELELISTVDVARLRLAGKSSEKALAAVAGAPCVSRLVTFDGRGRRPHSGAVESYSAALRQPGELPVPEKGEEGGGAAAATWVTQEAACRDLGNGSHDAKIVCERAGSFVLCVLLEGNIVLERPITVAPAPTDAPSCELQITAQMVRGNLELRAGEELVFSVAPRDRYGNASGGAPTAAAKTFSWALAPPKRKEEEGKEAAPAKADADDDEAAAADALAKAEAAARQGERAAARARADGGGGGGARRRAERGRHPPRGAPPRRVGRLRPARPPQTGRRAAGAREGDAPPRAARDDRRA